jgi:hypothetical protein
MSKGHVVRFFVENSVGRTSSVWRVWANDKTPDVYFAHRESAGELKGSLHASGRWQYGMTQQRLKTAHNIRGWKGASRHLIQWERPSEIAPGLTLAVEFAFPSDELQFIPALEKQGCIAIPAAPPDQAILVALFLARPGAFLGGNWPGERDMQSKYLADFPLSSGERVYLVYTTLTPPAISRQDLIDKRREFAYLKESQGLRARFCSVVTNDDGSRLFIEAAVHPDSVAVP